MLNLNKIVKSDFLKQLLDKWLLLSKREKWMLATLTIMLIVFLYYYLLAKPLQQGIKNQKLAFAHSKQVNQWLENNEPYINDLKAQTNDGEENNFDDNQAVATIVENAKMDSALRSSIDRIVSINNDEVEIWFINIDFNNMINWLSSLQNYKIDAQSVIVEKVLADQSDSLLGEEYPGRVDVRLTLSKYE